MSILESMRSGTDSTAMQVVLALVLVSFVFWYSQPQGDTTQVVATVNGAQIKDTELSRRMRIRTRQYERALSDAEARAVQEQVRQELIQEEVLRQHAVELGITVSDTEVARQLLQYEIFLNEEGKFDERIYSSWLRRNAYASRSEFEEDIREDLLRAKLRQLVFMGVTVSEPVLERTFVEQNTRVDLEYVRVRPKTFTDDVEISDEAIDTFLETSMERVKGAYEADFDRLYNLPEKVGLTLIRLQLTPDGPGAAQLRPRLEDLKAALAEGGDMAELARKWSEHPTAVDGGSMGVVAVPQLSPEASDAVRGLEPGDLSEIVVEDDHMSVYRLESREPARVIEIEEVQREIAERLIREDEAPALAAAYAERLLDAWKEAGEAPEDVLGEQGLVPAQTGLVPLTGGRGQLFSPPIGMLEAAGKLEVGAVLPDVYTKGDVLWVGVLAEREEADMDMLQDEREMVHEAVLQQRRTEFFQGWVDQLVAQASVQ